MQKRSEAEDAIRLMTRSAESKLSAERSRNGLIILHADYGIASAFTDRGIRRADEDEHGGPTVIDVTVPLQALVTDSRVTIPGGRSKCDLLGFYDPCLGESKKLRVRYTFKDVLHEVTVGDKDVLRIPMKGESLALHACQWEAADRGDRSFIGRYLMMHIWPRAVHRPVLMSSGSMRDDQRLR